MADKSIIGTDLGTVTFPVERGKVREFANAILEDNPAFQEQDAPAPLTFSMTRSFWPNEGGDMSKKARLFAACTNMKTIFVFVTFGGAKQHGYDRRSNALQSNLAHGPPDS